MSRKRRHSVSPVTSANKEIYQSTPIKDRDSTFIGYFSPGTTEASGRTLQSLQQIASASHRIAAWRVPSKQTSVKPGAPRPTVSGHDDDGEKYAGSKLERVLQEECVQGIVVVARWYGGTMLGPVRFTHIEKCAREAIASWRDAITNVEEDVKRQKRNDDDTARLRKELPQRDSSIIALRQLLKEKNTKRTNSPTPAEQAKPIMPATPEKDIAIDYSPMELEVLRRLEKARDTTIALLLRKIDEAEK